MRFSRKILNVVSVVVFGLGFLILFGTAGNLELDSSFTLWDAARNVLIALLCLGQVNLVWRDE